MNKSFSCSDVMFLPANYLKVSFQKWWAGWWDSKMSLEKGGVNQEHTFSTGGGAGIRTKSIWY
jgi:hypothetical protein